MKALSGGRTGGLMNASQMLSGRLRRSAPGELAEKIEKLERNTRTRENIRAEHEKISEEEGEKRAHRTSAEPKKKTNKI